MTCITRVLPALALGLVMAVPAGAAGQSQQQVDDLRRRVEEVERQLFQQRLAVPAGPQGQDLDRLMARIQQLELEMASERIGRMAASVASRPSPSAVKEPKSLEARVADLEAQHEADAKTIAALVKRIEALEKPPAKPKVIK